MNISFLFGSGISKPAGYPMMSDITKRIMNFDRPTNHQFDTTFSSVPKERIELFIKLLIDETKNHYSFALHDFSYEDLYYLIDSIYQDEVTNYENPIVGKFSDLFLDKYPELFFQTESYLGDVRLVDLCKSALDYIKHSVIGVLQIKPQTIEHLCFLNDVEKDHKIDQIQIFTLNHDLMLEQFFNENKIVFSDGFLQGIWRNSFKSRFNIYKLHGSLGWYAHDIIDAYEPNINKTSERGENDPVLLIGSFNKLHEYTRNIYFEMLFNFHHNLRNSSYLIISGYGFGDQGINTRIISWANSSRSNRLLLIHKDIDEVKSKARMAIKRKIDEWRTQGVLIYVPKFIEQITWEELRILLI